MPSKTMILAAFMMFMMFMGMNLRLALDLILPQFVAECARTK